MKRNAVFLYRDVKVSVHLCTANTLQLVTRHLPGRLAATWWYCQGFNIVNRNRSTQREDLFYCGPDTADRNNQSGRRYRPQVGADHSRSASWVPTQVREDFLSKDNKPAAEVLHWGYRGWLYLILDPRSAHADPDTSHRHSGRRASYRPNPCHSRDCCECPTASNRNGYYTTTLSAPHHTLFK